MTPSNRKGFRGLSGTPASKPNLSTLSSGSVQLFSGSPQPEKVIKKLWKLVAVFQA